MTPFNGIPPEEDHPIAAETGRGSQPRPPDVRLEQPHAHPAEGWSALGAILRVPLFWKIVLANMVLVALALAVAVPAAQRGAAEGATGGFAAMVIAALAITALVNGLIVHLALVPLSHLEEAARRIQDGDWDARAPVSPLADRPTEQLIGLFNAMLDGLSAYRHRLREIAARALNAEEEERKRIARELHDDTAQSLAAILIRLRIARTGSEIVPLDTLMEDVRQEIAGTLEGIRRYARGLRPPALDELGLIPAIESYARTLTEGAGLPVSVHGQALGNAALSKEEELALYRIVQEALSNVVRHAEATHATVRVRRVDGMVVATVEDDGSGFDVDNVVSAEGGGLGLFGMQERAAYVGGRVSIDSQPNSGTMVRVEVPVWRRHGTPEA